MDSLRTGSDIETQPTGWVYLGLLFGVVTVLWLLSWFLMISNETLASWAQRSAFGDMFGAINALFSGLAFAGVVYAIFLQKRELELQRREIARNRLALERSATAQEQSLYLQSLVAYVSALSAVKGHQAGVGARASKRLTELEEIMDMIRPGGFAPDSEKS